MKVGDDEIDQPVVPAICTNDEILELHAVLAGRVLGQLAGVTAAPYIRSSKLVPLLVDHIPERTATSCTSAAAVRNPLELRVYRFGLRRPVHNTEYV